MMTLCNLLLLLTVCMTYHVDSLAPMSSLQCRRPHHGIGSCKIRSSYPIPNTPQSIYSSALSMADAAAADAATSKEELDIDGTISSWSRLISAIPKLKRRQSPPDELDRKILSTALPTMLNLMVVPLGK